MHVGVSPHGRARAGCLRHRQLEWLSNERYYGSMLVATITEAKNRLSALIDRVKAGETVLIVDRGTPVARLESAVAPGVDQEGRLARLERAGAVRPARVPPATAVLSSSPPHAVQDASAVDVLIDERRSGR